MSKDYTWRCDCEAEGTEKSLSQAKKEAKQHVKVHRIPHEVFIDEYDSNAGEYGGGELTGRYWKVRNM